jgi:hypothetical protein
MHSICIWRLVLTSVYLFCFVFCFCLFCLCVVFSDKFHVRLFVQQNLWTSDMIWYDMIWYMIWYDMIWYDMIWYVCSPAMLKGNSHIPCRSPAATLPRPCHYLATTLSLPCHSPTVLCSSLKFPYLVHEVILLSPYRNYLLLRYYNLCAVKYTSTHVLAPK